MAGKKKPDTVRVRFHQMMAGPAITYRIGDEVDLSPEAAARLVEGGVAAYVGTPSATPPVETSTDNTPAETSTETDDAETGLAPEGDETRAEE